MGEFTSITTPSSPPTNATNDINNNNDAITTTKEGNEHSRLHYAKKYGRGDRKQKKGGKKRSKNKGRAMKGAGELKDDTEETISSSRGVKVPLVQHHNR